jgi:Family of unknown function (DUF6527)
MRPIPLCVVERFFRLGILQRPRLLTVFVAERPDAGEMTSSLLMVEKRGGHLKWAHFQCPKCGDHIQLPLSGEERWSITIDFLRRPTLAPSVWERRACGAHFFVRKGETLWFSQREGGH